MLYILTSVWVLRTPKAGQNSLNCDQTNTIIVQILDCNRGTYFSYFLQPRNCEDLLFKLRTNFNKIGLKIK